MSRLFLVALALSLPACGRPRTAAEPLAPSPAGSPASSPVGATAPAPVTLAPAPTLRADVQQIIDRVLEPSEFPVGVVALDVEGRLVALGSHAGADPARDALRPGSTVKPLLALGAARAKVQPSVSYTCNGTFAPVAGLTCFGEHGPLDLASAIEQSCNVYFYDVAHRLGLPGVHGVFRHYRFATSTGLVEGESPGSMPGEAVLRPRQPDPGAAGLWPGFASSVGIGHGPLQVTLLQLTRAYAMLARELQSTGEPELAEVKRQVLEGLRRVVETPLGTGDGARVEGLEVAGKTGSAEPGRFDDETSETGKHNSWFVGFAPARRPELVVGAVCLGGARARCAPPIVGSVLKGVLGSRR